MINITNHQGNANQNYKTVMRYHLTPVRMSIKKKKIKITSIEKALEKLECLCNGGCYRKKYQLPQKTKNTMIV